MSDRENQLSSVAPMSGLRKLQCDMGEKDERQDWAESDGQFLKLTVSKGREADLRRRSKIQFMNQLKLTLLTCFGANNGQSIGPRFDLHRRCQLLKH
ncbi:MAG: hypothetical protein JKX94_06815 [Sneathiella sp.]|nr:hypothetical protein [Sneathiella sp.]